MKDEQICKLAILHAVLVRGLSAVLRVLWVLLILWILWVWLIWRKLLIWRELLTSPHTELLQLGLDGPLGKGEDQEDDEVCYGNKHEQA